MNTMYLPLTLSEKAQRDLSDSILSDILTHYSEHTDAPYPAYIKIPGRLFTYAMSDQGEIMSITPAR